MVTPPVSDCRQVSTIGQRPSPTTRWYHSQDSGLIGSPTEPSRRTLARLVFFPGAVPSRIRARMAVGGVKKMLSLFLSIHCQKREASDRKSVVLGKRVQGRVDYGGGRNI